MLGWLQGTADTPPPPELNSRICSGTAGSISSDRSVGRGGPGSVPVWAVLAVKAPLAPTLGPACSRAPGPADTGSQTPQQL